MSENFKDTRHDFNGEKEKDASQTDSHQKSIKNEKPVILSAEAYKTIILYANRYANNSIPQNEWKEVYGVLIGYSDEDFVHIVRAEALTFGHSTDVQLEEKHYVFISNIQEELVQKGEKYYIIGWFHSHPGFSPFFSIDDLINQLYFQGVNDDAIGLVYDHSLLGKKKKEKIYDENGQAHEITKYDTGFEIYRITNINLNFSDPNFENNYHAVDYIIEGLNKYFFANLMRELSERVQEGKPLQSAYSEYWSQEYKDPAAIKEQVKENHLESELLEELFLDEQVIFNDTDVKQSLEHQLTELDAEIELEQAEKYFHEGKIAFKKKDTVSGVELFTKAINIHKRLQRITRVLEIYHELIIECINNEHFTLAEEFSEKLIDLANQHEDLFHAGEGYYLKGYILLKTIQEDEIGRIEQALKELQESAKHFTEAKDYIGAGLSFERIGMTYQARLNVPDMAGLFLREAIENYNKGIMRGHPLRTSPLYKPEMIIQKIKSLKDLIEDLLPNIKDLTIKNKIITDLQSIHFNF
ncbi:MAG: hypothetical protein ACTSXH_17635 [Promethearchaeota archaeon]